MSKILVIAPHRILQQAIALSLFPDHEVQCSEAVPEAHSPGFQDYQMAIVDMAALREKSSIDPATMQALEGSNMPMIWLEVAESAATPNGNVAVVHHPVAKEALLAAVAQCLSTRDQETPGRSRAASVKENTTDSDPQIVELVDVIEDEQQK